MRPDTGVPLIEMTTYAVDVRTMRILTTGTHLRPRKKDEMPPGHEPKMSTGSEASGTTGGVLSPT